MTTYLVTLYHFANSKLISTAPQVVEASSPIQAAALFVETPLSEHGSIGSLAAEVKEFDRMKLKQRSMFYHRE